MSGVIVEGYSGEDLHTLDRLHREIEQLAAERDAARRWATVWKRLCKRTGFVIHNFRAGEIYRVQQARIAALEQENERLRLVAQRIHAYVHGTYVETGPLRELCAELARQDRKG